MWVALLIIAGLVLLAAVCLAATYSRRRILTRDAASVAMAARIHARAPGRGWAPGYAVYAGPEVRWYRMFSLSPRPRFVLRQGDLMIIERREPEAGEELMFPDGVRLLVCKTSDKSVELAMSQSALTGFSSWSEAAPPGFVG
ncbi:DUF2550 domain-containing protein [Salininema proteolyticum]|uniref:DUF2550 domain-containing protein n=1 Tax=Salininema proteolyticum TaxID=1607685 RepID=A0ABV8U3E7_9ACTN